MIYETPDDRQVIQLSERAVAIVKGLSRAMDHLVAQHGYTGFEVAEGTLIYAALVNKLNTKLGHEDGALSHAIFIHSFVLTGRCLDAKTMN